MAKRKQKNTPTRLQLAIAVTVSLLFFTLTASFSNSTSEPRQYQANIAPGVVSDTAKSPLHGSADDQKNTTDRATTVLKANFKDIGDHWAEDDILFVQELCDIQGFRGEDTDGDGEGDLLNEFRPDAYITRAELVQMIVQCAFDTDLLGDTPSEFPDVDNTHWVRRALNFAKKQGWVEGNPDGNFHPDQNITRAAALKVILLSKVAEELLAADGEISFPDVPPGIWFRKFVHYALSKGYVRGYEDGTFRPGAFITRAEAAKIISRIYSAPVLSNEESI